MKNETTISPAYMRRADAARYLGISTRCLSDWQAKRIIPYIKVRRKCVLFRRADLERALNRYAIDAVGD